ncbi:MAG: hypothetical protein U1E49_18560 [Hyphomicrobiaceae bacterium]
MQTGRKRAIGVALLAIIASTTVVRAQTSEQAEPPLLYQLKAGDKTVPLSEGVPTTIEGSFTNPSVTLEVEPYRIFPHGGVEFRYPRHFTFEVDFSAPDVKIWTLSGNSFKIMYFVTTQPLTVDSFIESMSQQAEPDQVRVDPAPVTIALAGQSLAGKRVIITLAGQSIATDAFALPPGAGTTRLLVLQDSPTAPGTPTQEATSATGLLTQSFVLKP